MTVPSITGWSRLEPRTRDAQMRHALAARIHDPLWLLGRQWQIGEFRGHDGGSPVKAQVETDEATLARYAPGPPDDGAAGRARRYDVEGMPLETLVERETVRRPAEENLHLAGEAGLHFLRLLAVEGVRDAYRDAYVQLHPLPEVNDPGAGAEAAGAPVRQVLAGRVPNGHSLHEVLWEAWQGAGGGPGGSPQPQPGWLPPRPLIAPLDREAVERAATAWLAWYRHLFTEPAPGEADPWTPGRLEYQFAVSAPVPGGEVVLAAPDYSHGHLDWDAFTIHPGASLGRPGGGDSVRNRKTTAIPAPAASAGMPAARWWEFERTDLDFGNVEVAPEDLLRLPWMQFALWHASDWFTVPMDLPVGALHRVRSLLVTDTFGNAYEIPPITAGASGQAGPRLFRVSVAPGGDPASAAQEWAEALFLPPVPGPSLHSEPLEDVLFLRDDAASLVWAVEKVVVGPEGVRVHRQEEEDRVRGPLPEPAEPGEPGGMVAYRLGTTVPGHWVPLKPVRDDDGTLWLRRAKLLQPGGDRSGSRLQGARGRVLGTRGPLLLDDEQVPRAGARVTRAHQYARWLDGRTLLWVGRRKQPGRGEGDSGLRFDVVAGVGGDAGERHRPGSGLWAVVSEEVVPTDGLLRGTYSDETDDSGTG